MAKINRDQLLRAEKKREEERLERLNKQYNILTPGEKFVFEIKIVHVPLVEGKIVETVPWKPPLPPDTKPDKWFEGVHTCHLEADDWTKIISCPRLQEGWLAKLAKLLYANNNGPVSAEEISQYCAIGFPGKNGAYIRTFRIRLNGVDNLDRERKSGCFYTLPDLKGERWYAIMKSYYPK